MGWEGTLIYIAVVISVIIGILRGAIKPFE